LQVKLSALKVAMTMRYTNQPIQTRDLCQIYVHVAYGHGSVLLRQRDKIPKGRGILGVLFPTDNAMYSIAFWTLQKTAKPIEMPFGMIIGFDPRNTVLRGVTIPEGKFKGQFWGKTCPTSLTLNRCELDWSIQRRAHDRGRCFISSVGLVYYRLRRDG